MKIVRAGLFAASFVLGACFVAPSTSATDPGNGLPGDTTAADTKQMTDLTKKLEGFRTQAMDKSAMELDAHHNALFWKTYPGFAPILHRHDAGGATLDFGFSIGAGDDNNYRATEDLVVTAERAGGNILYHAYDAHSASKELRVGTFPAPSDEQKWFAFAVSGTTVYVITTPSGTTTGHTIWTFTLGSDPVATGTLESLGMQVGELLDFDVDGNTMMVVESGRLWRCDLAAKTAKMMGNKTEISGAVNFSADGVVWEDATGLKFFDYGAASLRDVSQELHDSPYKINATFKDAHYFYSATTGANFGRWRDWVLYTGNSGIFAYDLKSKAVEPVLLDTESEENGRIAYRYPLALDNGAAFIVGLTSSSGSVGADGPVYQTDLNKVLAP